MSTRAAALTTLLLLLVPAAAQAAVPNSHNTGDCLFCHLGEPRFGVDTRGTVTFTGGSSWDDPGLCLRCHAENENLHPLGVKPGEGKRGTAATGTLPLGASSGLEGAVVCETCHFVHAADSEHALLRGFPGSQEGKRFSGWQDFCRSCHGTGLERESPHGGDEGACVFCHQAVPKEGSPAAVAPQGPRLCNFCHGGIQDGHFDSANPYGPEASCLTCHGPHLGPESPGRLKPSYLEAVRGAPTVSPHYRRAFCFACHGEGEKRPLLEEDPALLCNRCHGAPGVVGDAHPLKPPTGGMKLPEGWPLRDGSLTCLTCHRSGHPEDRGVYKFLRGGPYEDRNAICFGCHDREVFRERNPHEDVSALTGCEFCHAGKPVPGEKDPAKLRLVADTDLLCLRCHDYEPHPAGVSHTVVPSPAILEGMSDQLPLDAAGRVTCATCHNPHVEETEGSKLRGGVQGMMICSFCHRY